MEKLCLLLLLTVTITVIYFCLVVSVSYRSGDGGRHGPSLGPGNTVSGIGRRGGTLVPSLIRVHSTLLRLHLGVRDVPSHHTTSSTRSPGPTTLDSQDLRR